MHRKHMERPLPETPSPVAAVALQTQRRLALQTWNGITVAALVLYAIGASLSGERTAFTWSFTGAGLSICAAVFHLARRSKHVQAGRVLLGVWGVALVWMGIHHGPLASPMLAGILPASAAAVVLSPLAGLVTGWSLAAGEILLIALAVAGLEPLAVHAQQVSSTGLAITYPALMAVVGTSSWLLARAPARAIGQISALAHSWEQGQQTLENRAIERSRKVQEANRQLARHAKQIEVSAGVARLCSQGIPLDQVLQESVKLLQTQLDLYHVLLYVLGPDQKHLVPKAGHGAAGQGLLDRLPETSLDDGSAASRAFAAKEPVINPGSQHADGWTAPPHLALAHSWAAFPLVCSGMPLGVIELYSEQPSPFDGAVLAVIGTVASQLAFALAGSSQTVAPGSAADIDVVLAKQLSQISEAGSSGDIGQILMTAIAATPVVFGRLLLVEQDSEGVEWIVMRESWSCDERPAEPVGTRLRLDDYPWAAFLSRSDPMVVEDVQTDRRATEAALIAARVAGIGSLISIPLTTGAGWAGSWLIGRAEPSAYEPFVIRRYLALGRVAALALDNLRLRSALRHQAQHERLRAAVAAPLAAPFDTNQLLQHTVQSIGRILGVSRVAVHVGSGWEEANGD